MDFQRVLLYLALSVLLIMLWGAWQRENAPQLPPQTATTAPAATSAPTTTGETPADVPTSAPVAAAAPAEPGAETAASSGQLVRVRSDVLDLEIDLAGGTIRQALLRKYSVSIEEKNTPFTLLEDDARGVYLAQSGLLGESAPDHHAVFTAAGTDYVMAEGQKELVVPLVWVSDTGVKVTKTFTLTRGDYLVKMDYQVENGSSQPWSGRLYAQLQRSKSLDAGHSKVGTYTYTGGAISSPEKRYEKVTFDAMTEQNLSRDVQGGWVAMIQHYFVSAWVPGQKETNHLYTKALPDDRFIIGLVEPTVQVEPGASASLGAELYVGPQDQARLAEIAPHLDLTVDYGWLWFIAKPLFWLLKWFHNLLGNWGVAIILVTLLIKLAFYKLSATSYRSMANMRRMAPKMQALKERYAGDREKLNHAMMELYKKEKINPLGGCLPIVVQIPVFIALYWMLLGSVELRQAPFMLWIQDLSVKDPYFVLPLLMGVSMFIQQKLNPAPPDPIQAKVMMALPFIFTVFFAFFPAGLVLYWFVNNLISIAQQWFIMRRMEQGVASATS